MKKIFALLFMAGATVTVTHGQNDQTEVEMKAEKVQCKSYFKTPPIRVLMKMVPAQEADPEVDWNYTPKDRKHEGMPWDQIDDHGIQSNNNIDPVLQTTQGDKDGSNMHKANWQGLSSSGFPPDPSGAAGMNYYVQAVNSSYRVWNKDGTPVSGAPVMGLSSLWPGSSSDGDPIIMYDRYADRWFISQFQTPPDNEILIAISETSDPLGSYHAYTFSFSSFPDYPKFGVWSNGYYMTANTNGPDCVVFERDKMLVGDAGASQMNMYFPSMSLFFNSIAPAYAEGPNMPGTDEDSWAFAVQDDSWFGVSNDHINICKIHVDWDTPSNSNVVIHQDLSLAPFNSVFTSSWDDIQQPGTSQRLDAVAGIFMYRAQWRRFEDYDVMLLVQTVDVNGANRAGVRWHELRMDSGSDQWYVHQEGTYDPNDGLNRWMGSAAMDLNGNIGLAYCVSGTSEFPGIRFTGRFDADAAGTMSVQEQNAMDGTSSQTITNRYGDYSQMTVDPADDATFWMTAEYMGPGGSPKTRIFSFAMWELLGQEEPTLTSNPFFNAYQPNTEELTIVWKDLQDDNFDLTIMDMNGKIVAMEQGIDASVETKTFPMPANAAGIYLVTIQGENTQMTDKIWIAK